MQVPETFLAAVETHLYSEIYCKRLSFLTFLFFFFSCKGLPSRSVFNWIQLDLTWSQDFSGTWILLHHSTTLMPTTLQGSSFYSPTFLTSGKCFFHCIKPVTINSISKICPLTCSLLFLLVGFSTPTLKFQVPGIDLLKYISV